jgi:hypothetical protein
MTLTRKHKLYVGLVGLALAAFLVDRFVLSESGPAPAAASVRPPTVPAAIIAGAPAPGDAKAAPEAAAPRPSVAARLAALEEVVRFEPDLLRDAFVPPASWLPATPEPKVIAEAPPEEKAVDDRFGETHRLSSLMLAADGGIAIVNGKAVRVGGTLDGYTLTAVQPGSAVFERDGRTVELRLRQDSAAPTAQSPAPVAPETPSEAP